MKDYRCLKKVIHQTDSKNAGLPRCPEYQELSRIWETLLKNQENIKKIDESLELPGKCQEFSMMC